MPTRTNTQSAEFLADQRINGSRAATYQQKSDNLVARNSNQGSANPMKGPTPRTLFYNGGFYKAEDAKNGQFLFYTLGSDSNEFFVDEYYKSERTKYNKGISSYKSRNPAAGTLVSESNIDHMIGNTSAPYHWKDFLYCKYYGTIPNNYMITLRRFPAPMRDNLSLPPNFRNTTEHKDQGAGKPVAQAVTWWGGPTENSLDEIIGFSAGIKWNEKTQEEVLEQEGFDKGFFKSVLGKAFAEASGDGAGLLATLGTVATVAVSATQGGSDEVTVPKINYSIRDKATRGDSGPLSDFIYQSVDTVDKTWMRGRGLTYENNQIEIKFHYELTSVGEVNTKMAMIDLLGNLLGLGTNYGQFLTPDIRYNNEFPAIGFPGGNEGLMEFYSDPVAWTKKAIKYMSAPSGETMDNPEGQEFVEFKNRAQELSSQLQSMLEQLANNTWMDVLNDPNVSASAKNALTFALSTNLISEIALPLGVKTGAPTGEWHLVIGNPMNPVAMIGNLICHGVKVEFGEVLGPDDFPTELVATYTLRHGRDRERGEIESIFNRGDGRLYQSVIETYANQQSIDSLGTVDGKQVKYASDGTTIDPANSTVTFNSNGEL